MFVCAFACYNKAVLSVCEVWEETGRDGSNRLKEKGREGKRRAEKGREGKRREEKGREGKRRVNF